MLRNENDDVFILDKANRQMADRGAQKKEIGKAAAPRGPAPVSPADELLSPRLFVEQIQGVGELLAELYDSRSGMTRTQTRVLMALLEEDGRTQTELANALGIHKVSVGVCIQELETLGYVERRSHPTDKRAKCMFATQRLHEAAPVGARLFADLHRSAINGIAREDYVRMLECLEQMRVNLEAERDRRDGA